MLSQIGLLGDYTLITLVSELRRKASRLAAGCAVATGLALSGLSVSAYAQTDDYSGVEADPALWLITDDDSEVWLFGTFHILPPSLDWQTDELTDLVSRLDTMYLEVDARSPESQARMQALIPQLGMNASGVTLSSQLDAESLDLLNQILPTMGAPLAAFEPMRPWLAQLFLAVTKMQMLGLDPNAGVEMSLMSLIEGQGVEMGYFETVDEQLSFFADIPDEVIASGFAEGLRQLEKMPETLDDMIIAWATGDVGAIDQLVNAETRELTPEVYEAIIVQRNLNWIPEIENILEGEGVVMVAVGAGHMPGENGVIELLRARGYTVTRQ